MVASGALMGPQLSDSLETASKFVRDYVAAVSDGRLQGYSRTERRVREATRNEPWGPTGPILQELAAITSDHAEIGPILAMLARRLDSTGFEWRHVYKALTVIEYLATRGSEAFAGAARGLVPKISVLTDTTGDGIGFQYVDPKTHKDEGINVRHKAVCDVDEQSRAADNSTPIPRRCIACAAFPALAP